MHKIHVEKNVYSWIWILALSISSRNLELYFSDHYLIYKMKFICLVKLWSVRKSHIASKCCLPINKCSCHCCYHCCNIYFIFCYLGDERVQSIKQRSLQREPSEQIGKDEVGGDWYYCEMRSVCTLSNLQCCLCQASPVPSLPLSI